MLRRSTTVHLQLLADIAGTRNPNLVMSIDAMPRNKLVRRLMDLLS
jgi:hypothetical protein